MRVMQAIFALLTFIALRFSEMDPSTYKCYPPETSVGRRCGGHFRCIELVYIYYTA
jgi:hypothetical protein